jgi:uncharacterized zinc-type alcohol dehydrogenase-like protein
MRRAAERVGVVGVGGLGHMALQFLNKWGCEVFAFTSSENKKAELLEMGAHHVVNSKDPEQLKPLARLESGQARYRIVLKNDWS